MAAHPLRQLHTAWHTRVRATLQVPPLRVRPKDIAAMQAYFLRERERRASSGAARRGLRLALTPAALRHIESCAELPHCAWNSVEDSAGPYGVGVDARPFSWSPQSLLAVHGMFAEHCNKNRRWGHGSSTTLRISS